ncbi:MAG: TIGR04076 family protein [Anaerolineae bacterium]
MADESGAYRVICKVIRQEGHCAMGHKVGDEVIMDESGVHGTICFHALYSLMPKAFAMMYGATFPWLEDKDVATHACPDAENPVVFEVRRVR